MNKRGNLQLICCLLLVSILASCATFQSTPLTATSTLPSSSTPALPTGTPTAIPTSVFSSLPVISLANVTDIKEITRLSKGIVNEAVWFPDSKRIAVSTTVGVYIYDVPTGKELHYFETSASPSISINYDGKLLAAGVGTHVLLWDVETGQEKHSLEVTEQRVERVLFSPDEKILVAEVIVQFSDGEGLPETRAIVAIDISTGETLYTLIGRSWPVFNTNGNTLVTYFDHKIEFWDSHTGQFIHSMDGDWGFRLSPDDRFIAIRASTSPTLSPTIQIWNVQTWQPVCDLKSTDSFAELAFSPDGNTLSAGTVNMVEVWNTGDCQKLHILSGHSGYVFVAFSPDGSMLASYGRVDQSLKLWNAQNGKLVRTLAGFWGDPGDFSPDGQYLIEAQWYRGTIAIWDVNTGQVVLSLEKHTPHVGSFAFSPDGQTIATGHMYGHVNLWSLETGEIQYTTQSSSYVFKIAFAPNGRKIVSGETVNIANNEEAKLEIWDAASGNALFAWQSDNKNKTWMTDIEISPNDKYIAGRSSDQTIRLWDANTNEIKYIYVLTDGSTYTHDDGMAFSADGQVFAIVTSDNFIKFWNVDNGSLLFSLFTPAEDDKPTKIYFSPNGPQLIAAGYKTVWIYDMEARKFESTIENAGNNISNIAVDHEGTLLALSGWTGHGNLYEIKIFDLKSKEALVSISGHTDWITQLAFSPDDRLLASSSADGTLRLWGIEP